MINKEQEQTLRNELEEIHQEIDKLMDQVLELKEREYKIKCELYL